MDLDALLAQKMVYLNKRQSILAENVANSDTPGYKAKDLAPFTFGEALKQASIGMATTDARHIGPASMAGADASSVKSKSYAIMSSGNPVDLEAQMMEVSKTAIEHNTITALISKIDQLFNIALKGSNR